MKIVTHQQLEELRTAVEERMGVAYIRLDWMPQNEHPFEAKAFILDTLLGLHTRLCMQHVHRPVVDAYTGDTEPRCLYCSYGSSGQDAGGFVSVAEEFIPGVIIAQDSSETDSSPS